MLARRRPGSNPGGQAAHEAAADNSPQSSKARSIGSDTTPRGVLLMLDDEMKPPNARPGALQNHGPLGNHALHS
jgi:hypothetical protein